MKKENNNSFIEGNGIRILEGALEKTGRIKCYFKSNDKTPLFDGFFNFLNKNKMILKKFDVQIKTLTSIIPLKKGPNKGKYKYRFDTDVLDAVRMKITENPTFYFVINQGTEEVFFKYLSAEFLVSLNYINLNKKYVTYYFNNEEKLVDLNDFLMFLDNITKTSKKDIIFKSQKEIEIIQRSMNKFYKKLDKIDFIINELWPNLFKFGIRLSHSKNFIFDKVKDTDCMTYAIYPIEYGSTQKDIQEYDMLNDNLFNCYDMTGGITTDKYLDNCISNILYFYFSESNCLLKFLPNICLEELIFSFLDDITNIDRTLLSNKYSHTFYKEELSFGELFNIANPFFRIVQSILSRKDFDDTAYKCIKYFIKFQTNDKVYYDEKKINMVIRLAYCIEELKKRKITKIIRPWNYFVENSKILFSFSKSDLFDKTKFLDVIYTIFTNLPNYLNEIIDNTKLRIRNPLKGKYIYNVKLVDNQIKYYNIEIAVEDENSSYSVKNSLIQENKNYIWRCSSIVEDYFENYTPVFNFVRILFEEIICKNLEVKNKGVLIGNKTFNKLF